ncbi:MAG TPA: DUF4019 domain-containing protein, partial [Verrucomicrobiae bacterium]|nr:DUF4019 domain-containing protein [Verrucomicrobiae bacterium]
MDKGDYTRSWETAAPYFQCAITKEEWTARLQKVRHPLGKVLSRQLSSARLTAAGTRCEVEYKTSFDGLLAATETATFARQASGDWLAVGCLIRPAGHKNSIRYWRWFGITVLTAAALLFCGVLVKVVIPNLVRDRQAAFVQRQQEAAARKFGRLIPFVPPSKPEFGAAVEVTLPLHDGGYSDSLDPDSGKIVATPEMKTPWEWTTTLLPYGVMVIPQSRSNPTIVAGTSTLVWPLPNGTDYWDGRMALADATASGNTPITLGQTVMASSEGELPRLFCFQTPSGRRGLLQVVGFTGNPRGVKIRYKLVQLKNEAAVFSAEFHHSFAPRQWLDLAAGRVVRMPQSVSASDNPAGLDYLKAVVWAEGEGVQLTMDTDTNNPSGLLGVGAK